MKMTTKMFGNPKEKVKIRRLLYKGCMCKGENGIPKIFLSPDFANVQMLSTGYLISSF